jgi:Fur family ferric uptake transcriptional regulator
VERKTRQRDAVLAALRETGRPLGPAEILEHARAEVPSINLATVYRTLKLLVEAGDLKKVDLPGEPPRYEAADIDHHHHFRCDSCEKVYDITGCPPDLKHLLPAGFSLREHDLTLFGVCAACAAPKRTGRTGRRRV